MISNKERREISEKFLHEAKAWNDTFPDEVYDLGNAPGLMQDLCHFAGLDGRVLCSDIFQRFADLIDSTCKVVSIEPIEYGEFNETIGYVFNLTCGHQVMQPYAEIPPTYCIKCGKKVVKTDD